MIYFIKGRQCLILQTQVFHIIFLRNASKKLFLPLVHLGETRFPSVKDGEVVAADGSWEMGSRCLLLCVFIGERSVLQWTSSATHMWTTLVRASVPQHKDRTVGSRKTEQWG